MKPRQILTLLLAVVISNAAAAQNARQFYKTGLTFAEAGNHTDAIDQFTRALGIDPEFIQAYVERSRSHEATGALQSAADDLKRALAFETKDAELYYNAARLNFGLENYPLALELARKCISLESRHESAYRLLSRIQEALGDYSGALLSINRALALKDNAENNFFHGMVAEKMKNYHQAEIDYGKAVQKNNRYTDAYLALAALRLQLHKTGAAMESCNALLAYEPANSKALLIRSRIYAKQAEYPKAIDDISKILSMHAEDKAMYYVRGTYYQAFTQHQPAISDFTRALMIDGGYSEALHKRAFSYEQSGDFKSAVGDYETLVRLSTSDPVAVQYLPDVSKRLFELNRESAPPEISLVDPAVYEDLTLKIPRNKTTLSMRGKITDDSEISTLVVNNNPATFFRAGESFEFAMEVEIASVDYIAVTATDVYDNTRSVTFSITRTEIDPPGIAILVPYASDNGEIYLETDDAGLYVEGSIADESAIRSILIDGVTASFTLEELNPRFSATISVANKNSFSVTAADIHGNDTTRTFLLNRDGVALLETNPMGRTWVVFIENSDYETFPSLDGPSKDVALMRSALARYDIHKVIHKQDMTKKEMEKFFSIELRDLLRTNKVNALMIWYAGHGEFISETGYWIPADARRNDEFTYYNLNALRASLQSYANYITHSLVVTDACESGPTFCQVMRKSPKERNCNDRGTLKLRSSQVFSSAGYENATDNSHFTKTFASTLTNNTDACLPIESIADKVTAAVVQNSRQQPIFGSISGLDDEDGTFFFIVK